VQVDLSREERRQFLLEFEEPACESGIRALISKLGEEIKVASVRVKRRTRCGAEQLKVYDSMAPAQFFNLWQPSTNFSVHSVIIPDGGEIASPWVGFRAENLTDQPDWSRSD
jgi:hypothetical protein